MQELPLDCHIGDIPSRLHALDRPVIPIGDDDWLYMRHPPLADDLGYAFEIPGHRVEDQSVNSEKLNQPDGNPRDVLFDTRFGNHHIEMQIARLGAGEVRSLDIPNINTIRKNGKGEIIQDADRYRFEVVHKPTPCMYPHCEIITLKNGERKPVSSGIKSAIRWAFAQIADRHRHKMLGS